MPKKNNAIINTFSVLIISGCATDNTLYHSRKEFISSDDETFITSYNIVQPVKKAVLTWTKSAKPESNPDPTITLTPIIEYADKFYLYYKTNGLYNDSASFFTDVNGRPDGDKSATSSEQQLGVLTSSLIQVGMKLGAAMVGWASMPDDITEDITEPPTIPCLVKISDVISFTEIIDISNLKGEITSSGSGVYIDDTGNPILEKDEPKTGICEIKIKYSIESPFLAKYPDIDTGNGFLVYDPAPANIWLFAPDESIIWHTSFETYNNSHLEKPTRGFWTKPANTYAFKNGVMIGHTYTQQSPIKTVVDFILAPVQAVLPGVSHSSTSSTSADGKTNSSTTSGLTFK
jgi:hypothetical protein